LKNRLSKDDLDKILRDSYKTTIISSKPTKQGQKGDEEEERRENLKKKYAKFTT